MDKLKMHSLDGVERNIELIGKLFPNAITEVMRDGKVEHAIDFDVLRQELSDSIVEGREERYQFTWPDKKKAMLVANAPITATLRPVKADSVGKDGTPGGFDSENLYIEGDNLEVLKLLQETYLGKVKMIYIDPPYNTGNDFVYNDDFSVECGEWRVKSGDYDESGNRMVTNTESNGRFHTDWLNMIYPRLKIAKDLLSNDGVVFISIDDNELNSIISMGKEIFGADNYIATFIWEKRKTRENRKIVSVRHDYIVCFIKNFEQRTDAIGLEPMNDDAIDRYKNPDGDPRGVWTSVPAIAQAGHGTQNQFYTLTSPKGLEFNPPSGSCWRYTKEKMQEAIADNRIWFGSDGMGVPRIKKFLTEGKQGLTPETMLFADKVGTNDSAKRELVALFGGIAVFETPKPVSLIAHFIRICNDSENGIFLDFFSGTGTTAHAVMQVNAEDGRHRKFIMVQLPEKTDEKSEAYKAGYKNICEIGKERIRRAGKQILSAGGQLSMDGVRLDTNSTLNTPNSTLDVGFRCLRLDDSNMKPVYYTPEEVSQQDMFSLVDNVKEDRTPEDLLFQVMLDLGVLLSSPIEVKEIAGKKVFNVADGFLLACFDHDVTEDTVKAIAQMKPYYAVFRDSSMANDSVATNFDQIFETYSPETVRKVL